MKKTDRKKKHYRKPEGVRKFRIIVFFIFVVCFLVGAVCIWYYGKLQRTIQDESKGYLEEITQRIQSNIERIIDDTYAMLFSFGGVIETNDIDTFEKFGELAEKQQGYWKYKDLLLIDNEGNAYNKRGDSVVLSGDAYLRNTLLRGEKAMSPLQMVDGEESSIFSIPVAGVKIGGIEISALAVTFNPDTFGQNLSLTAFNNRAYSNIVSQDGTIIIQSDSEEKAEFGYNILNSIEASGSLSKAKMDSLRNNMVLGKHGQVSFTFQEREEYMVYSPIGTTDWYLYTFVPTDVVNEKSNILLTITILLCGFVVTAFTLLTAVFYISTKRYRLRLEEIAYVDSVTGGNTIECFYELARRILNENKGTYVLVFANLGKFKVFNEKFGRDVGDEILRAFYDIIEHRLGETECIGRLSGDNFCILLNYENLEILCERFALWYKKSQEYIQIRKPIWSFPATEFGVYEIEDSSMLISQMIDRAKLALQQTARQLNSKLVYALYNDEVRSKLFRDKQIEDVMDEALEKREFQVYIQPKYRTQDKKIAGGEALVRWANESEGMIYPDEFIPLFEKNGFIIPLDLYVFREVCSLIRTWIDSGIKPVKISVNCSRVHLSNQNFLQKYKEAVAEFQVPAEFLEIELTENIALEDVERFKGVIEEIHDAGFSCSMDDFGRGYSSLSMIQDISVDVLKLDKVFFRNERRDPVRTESVVSNIIQMAKALSMETVAEGVEYMEQVDMLKRVGCDLIQGYVFAKPMPSAEFEKLLQEGVHAV